MSRVNKYLIERDVLIESVSLINFRRYTDTHIPSFRRICKKMCSFYVTSSDMVDCFHEVTVGISEESKKTRCHNQNMTNLDQTEIKRIT